jgi:6-phosphogluconolactonase
MNERVNSFSDIGELSRAAAEDLTTLAQKCASESGRFSLALAGGHTPRRLYELLAGEYEDRMPWHAVHIFWGDERCVPPKDPDSNFRMAWEAMLSRVPIPETNIHRIPADKGLPGAAAEAYEETLFDHFRTGRAGAPGRGFDLILLGMGAEGHTASLFPDSSALDEKERWVTAVKAPEGIFPPVRITLTLPAINSAGDVFVLVSGGEKKAVLRKVLKGVEPAGSRFPVAMVRPAGNKVWYIDHAAGG